MDNIDIPFQYLMVHRKKDLFGSTYPEFAEKATSRMQRDLLQIYKLQFINCSESDLEQIRGRITFFTSVLFRREHDDTSHHDIDPKGNLRLKGPFCSLEADNMMYLQTWLYWKDHPEDHLHPDSSVELNVDGAPKGGRDALAAHEFDLNPLRWLCEEPSLRSICNRIMSCEMKTVCGDLKITYGVFNYGAECFLTLKILNWKDNGPANVFGRVVALNSSFGDDESAECLIYDRKRDEPECVKCGQFIVLQRPVYALGQTQTLKIKVDISHRNIDDSQSDKVIARRTFSFQSKCKRRGHTSSRHNAIIDSKIISGKWGKVQVKAYWLHYRTYV